MIRPVNYPFNINSAALANGCNMAYIDEGKGAETLVFIHGLATYALSWQKNITYLKAYYRCIVIDLPGNGLSDRGDYPYSIDFFAGCVYELILKLKLAKVCLVGHSMGGQIAMHLVLREPDCAEKLILCAPAGFETFNAFERSMYQSTISMAEYFSTEENSLRQTIRTSFYHIPAYADGMIDELILLMKSYPAKAYKKMIDGCIAGMLQEPVFDELKNIKQPTLVMYGDHDALIPNRLIHPVTTRHIAEEGTKRIPSAKLILVPKCGHFLQLEKPDVVNEHIRDFIERPA